MAYDRYASKFWNIAVSLSRPETAKDDPEEVSAMYMHHLCALILCTFITIGTCQEWHMYEFPLGNEFTGW